MESRYNLIINLFSTLFIVIASCTNSNNQNVVSTNQVAYTNKNEMDSINSKPINFYLQNKNCSPLAKNFYNGKFIPSDNDSTTMLLNLSITSDTILRPFYFWCLNSVIDQADGALMEYVGVPARRYIEKYPKEYFTYMSTKQFRKSKNNWITAINYSGYYENESSENKTRIKKQFISTILKNCFNCTASLKKEVNLFANECF
jgi:hypothetical protein